MTVIDNSLWGIKNILLNKSTTVITDMIYWSVGFYYFSSYTFLLSIFFVFLDDSWLFVSSILNTLYVTKWVSEFVSILLKFQRTRRFFRQKIWTYFVKKFNLSSFFKMAGRNDASRRFLPFKNSISLKTQKYFRKR
jgi:hypothetical protein